MQMRWIVATLLACAACKSKGDAGTAGKPDSRCEELAKTCGDNGKHVDKLREGCKQMAAPNCESKLYARYSCYE